LAILRYELTTFSHYIPLSPTKLIHKTFRIRGLNNEHEFIPFGQLTGFSLSSSDETKPPYVQTTGAWLH
jgi:hypothetical protein